MKKHTRKSPPRKNRGTDTDTVTVTAAIISPRASGTTTLTDVRDLILSARQQVAQVVNAGLTMLHWNIGKRIQQDILQNKRAEYGAEIIGELGKKLESEFGRGFGVKNLRHMVRFAEAFPEIQIVSSLIRQLAWTHFLQIIYFKDPLQRDFYAEMCRLERWSVRTLRKQIDSMLYERTALSKKPGELIRHELDQLHDEDRLTPSLVFKDPYILDFLGLKDRYLEKDIEDAILREMEKFLLEMGAGFTFVARQKCIQLDNDDHYIDLLLYNRKLRRLVALDLKLRDFKPGDKSQMELYLRWLARHEQESGEATPLGLILCAGKKHEQIELLELNKSGIHVAEYMTTMPSRDMLQSKLHQAIAIARHRFLETHPATVAQTAKPAPQQHA
jgi:predicted nuclease of restriction endonuclease-like (RecB) superfamily